MFKLEVLQEKPWYLQVTAFGVVALLVYGAFWYFVTSGTRAETAEVEAKVEELQRANAGAQIASQQGPVSLLSDINMRIPSDPDFRLASIELKGGELTVEGQSPNENAVTAFGRSLEFSGGLFVNVSIEAERKEVEVNPADYDPKDGPFDPTYRPETFRFKVKCKYGPSAPPPAAPAAPANQVAQK